MKPRQLRPKDKRGDNPVGGLRSLTGDPSTDSALWGLSLLLQEIAETNEAEQNEQRQAAKEDC